MQTHDSINNPTARQLTGITDANKMKRVFYRLRDQGKIRIIEGTRASATYWEKVPGIIEEEKQLTFEF